LIKGAAWNKKGWETLLEAMLYRYQLTINQNGSGNSCYRYFNKRRPGFRPLFDLLSTVYPNVGAISATVHRFIGPPG